MFCIKPKSDVTAVDLPRLYKHTVEVGECPQGVITWTRSNSPKLHSLRRSVWAGLVSSKSGVSQTLDPKRLSSKYLSVPVKASKVALGKTPREEGWSLTSSAPASLLGVVSCKAWCRVLGASVRAGTAWRIPYCYNKSLIWGGTVGVRTRGWLPIFSWNRLAIPHALLYRYT